MNERSNFEVDLELLEKYNQPGPRYTSYPTAPHFSSDFGAQDFYNEIVETNQNGNLTDLSLYFHLPFCKSLCYFCACNVIITQNPERIDDYLIYLKKEIDLVSKLINPTRKVVQLHWGGGTPTYLDPNQITDIFSYITDHFNFSDSAEISIEIDPRGLSQDCLSTLRNVGFNRVSFGVQDLDAKVQETVNRIQPESLNREVVKQSRELGFNSINIDLIYGLPYQTVESYSKTLDKIIDISPDRLAVFNYAHVPWLKKHQKLIPTEALPEPTERLKLLKLIIDKLTESGYVYIGMDHFAKPEDELTKALNDHTLYRNFQGYSTYAEAEIYAMGITSISQLNSMYAQNSKGMKKYKQALDQGNIPTHVGYRLNDDDKLRRFVIIELMCNNRVLKPEVWDRFGVDFDEYFSDSIEKLDEFIQDGLIILQPDRLQITEPGRLVIRNIAMVFDAYLGENQLAEKPVYSMTV